MKENIDKIISLLEKNYPYAKCDLIYQTEIQFLVSVILSARTTDIQVNKITAELFKYCKSASDFVDLGMENLRRIIHPAGFSKSKSKYIIETCNILLEKYNGTVPKTRESLIKLPGVGPKTANVVLGKLFEVPAMAVDTHVARVSNRIFWLNTLDVFKIEDFLNQTIPDSKKVNYCHQIIYHGRKVCKGNPKCDICFLNTLCNYTLSKIIIEDAKIQDLQSILKIENESFKIGWNFENFTDYLDQIHLKLKVVKYNKNVIGYLAFQELANEVEIHKIAILSEYRRRKIGTKLIQSLLTECINRIWLEVRVNSTSAIDFYKKIGFQIIGVRKNYYQDEDLDAVIMQLSLK